MLPLYGAQCIYNTYIAFLERIQRRFLRTISYIADGIYAPQGYPQELLLERFQMSSLLSRRIQHSIFLLFKILKGVQECPDILHNISLKVKKMNVRSKHTFYLPSVRTVTAAGSSLMQIVLITWK